VKGVKLEQEDQRKDCRDPRWVGLLLYIHGRAMDVNYNFPEDLPIPFSTSISQCTTYCAFLFPWQRKVQKPGLFFTLGISP